MQRRSRLAVAGLLLAFVAVQLWPTPPTVPGSDKAWHAVLYFAYAVALWPLLRHVPVGGRALLTFGTGLLTGVVLELLQGPVGRTTDEADLAADALGLAAACLALVVGDVSRLQTASGAVDPKDGQEGQSEPEQEGQERQEEEETKQEEAGKTGEGEAPLDAGVDAVGDAAPPDPEGDPR